MSNITVCARFRPLTSKEKQNGDDSSICIRSIDAETFIFKDDKDEEFTFSFDRVFNEKSEQDDVYQFLALPIVRDAVNAINGTIITYGQTGAGKTYSMEGPGILECDEQKKGLLPRVVQGLFDSLNPSDEDVTYSIKLSMVEIYMEKLRDLFDLSKDNIQIKESKLRGIILPGVTEITVLDPAEALQSLSKGIANRAVGETQMNVASSRSHCVYIFTIQQEFPREKRMRSGKLVLVDLAGSEKVEKTGAEGRVLEEAKTINKSLSALGNVINSLTCGLQGKASHIPYRDSKLTRILQDALGGKARTALLCCCSPSGFNASESLSTLRFGARAKHIKSSPRVSCSEEKCNTGSAASYPPDNESAASSSPPRDDSATRILNKLGERLNVEDVKLLEELFVLEGILFDPQSVEEEPQIEDLTFLTISSLQEALEKLTSTVDELKRENSILKAKVDASTKSLFLDAMDLPFLNAYLDSLGLPNFKKGCNFAAAGSTILPATASSVSPFSFGIQVSQFLRFKARALELLSKGRRFDKYIPNGDNFEKGLYMFDIGQNDLAGAFYSKTLDQVLASIPTILVEFETGIKKLYDQGARYFWIHNTGPLGCLPQNVAKFGTDPSKLDELGCVSSHNQAAKTFNLQLHALSSKLQGQYPDANVTYVDIFAIKSNLIANYSKYGFEQPIMACCGYGGPPLNYDSRVSCGQTKTLNGTTISATGCSDSTEYINWDGIHYTEAANEHVASQILTGKYSDPPFSDKMPFLLKLKF